MCLPHLKFMCLDGLLVSDVESTGRLFSSCPLLETLNIVDCGIQTDNQRNLTVESLRLKQFAYTEHIGYCRPHFKPISIKLSAPNLTSFTYKSYLTHDYNLPNCCDQLCDANLDILCNEYVKQLHTGEKIVYAKHLQ